MLQSFNYVHKNMKLYTKKKVKDSDNRSNQFSFYMDYIVYS